MFSQMSGGWTPSYTLTSEWKLTPYPPQLSAKDVPAAFLRINNYSLIIIQGLRTIQIDQNYFP